MVMMMFFNISNHDYYDDDSANDDDHNYKKAKNDEINENAHIELKLKLHRFNTKQNYGWANRNLLFQNLKKKKN